MVNKICFVLALVIILFGFSEKEAETSYWKALVGHWDTGETDYVRIDPSTNSLQVVGYEHHEIHSGSHFFAHGTMEFTSADDVLDFTWQMPDTAEYIHWTWQIETESEVNWWIYEAITATNTLANTWTPLNSNRNSAHTSAATLKWEYHGDLDAANADTDVTAATLIAAGICGDGKTAGDAKRSNEIVLGRNGLYCLRAEAEATGYINFKMDWYEHTDKH